MGYPYGGLFGGQDVLGKSAGPIRIHDYLSVLYRMCLYVVAHVFTRQRKSILVFLCISYRRRSPGYYDHANTLPKDFH